MNTDNNKPDMFKNKKEIEEECLIPAIERIPWLQKYKQLDNENQERPDFILEKDGERIGIEHMHIDLLYVEKKDSLSRYTYYQLKKMFYKYNPNAVNDEFTSDVANHAAKDLEIIINEIIECNDKFDYQKFINQWKRVFDNHYKKRFEYRKSGRLNKLGLLIEIRAYTKLKYLYRSKSSIYAVKKYGLPITKEIKEYISQLGDGVDFYIIVVKGLLGKEDYVQYFDNVDEIKIECDEFKLKEINGSFQLELKD